jgi:hypothetical protein
LTDAREHEALDAALDHLVQGLPADAPIAARNAAGEGLEPLLQTARAAREALSIEIPDDVARAHLAALLELPAIGGARPRHRVALVLVAAAITVLLLGGAAVTASASAGPGDLLYGVKRTVEKIELIVHRDPASRARLHLEFAQRRLTELSALLAQRRLGQSVDVGAAMSAYRNEVAQAQQALAADRSDPGYQALLASVDLELQRHLVVLAALRDNGQPGPASVAIQNAIAGTNSARTNVSQSRSVQPVTKPKPTRTPSRRSQPTPTGSGSPHH